MKLVGLDIETRADNDAGALMPWTPGFKLTTLVGLTNYKSHEYKYIWPTKTDVSRILNQEGTFVTWNGAFDFGCLMYLYPDLRPQIHKLTVIDSMLAWQRYDKMSRGFRRTAKLPGPTSYSLKEAVRLFFPEHSGYEDDVDYDVPLGTPKNDPQLQKLLEYNVLDVDFTIKLAEKFIPELSDLELSALIAESSMISLAAQGWVDGVLIDFDAWQHLCSKTQTHMKQILEDSRLQEDVIKSPAKLSKLLFDDWGLLPVKKTPSGKPSTDAATLLKLASEDDRVAQVYKFKSYMTQYTKFVTSVIDSVLYNNPKHAKYWIMGEQPTLPTHPSARIAGTYTGRLTYSSKTFKYPSGIALHQWQKDGDVRSLIRPPEGYLLAEFDASQQEMRLMAHMSKDPVMTKMFNDGTDLHTYMAAQIAGESYDDIVAKGSGCRERQLGKLANLSLQYRTSARKLVEAALKQFNLTITLDEAYRIRQTYLNTYEGVPAYWAKAIDFAKTHGYTRTLGGRRVSLHPWESERDWQYESTAINFPIQGSGADMKALATYMVKDFCLDHGIIWAFDLHDAIFYYIPERQSELLTQVLALLNSIDYNKAWGNDLRLDFPWTAAIGPHWGEMEEL